MLVGALEELVTAGLVAAARAAVPRAAAHLSRVCHLVCVVLQPGSWETNSWGWSWTWLPHWSLCQVKECWFILGYVVHSVKVGHAVALGVLCASLQRSPDGDVRFIRS